MLQTLQQLPSLPDNCFKLQELMDDPNSTPSDMAGVIESDVGLASKVLRLANSAHCAIPGGVDSLQRAVCFLGFSTIHQIVLCMQSYQVLGSCGNLPAVLTTHALAVASVAQRLCERAGLPMPQRAFSAGLLHDLGRVGLFVLFPDHASAYLEATSNGARHGIDLEVETFGFHHMAVGELLAKKWKYPAVLKRVIEDHHGEGAPVNGREEEQARKLADVVAVADAWSWALGHPGINAGEPSDLHEARAQRSGLPPLPPEAETADLQAVLQETPSFWS
jgi:putative nucleotidyltransferase with HDIG domain